MSRGICRCFRVPSMLLAVACVLLPTFSGSAAELLHLRIDRMIQGPHTGPTAANASDSDFLRRVFLDLNGITPSAAEVRAFLDDDSPRKREAVVDRLLNHPRYARHMANIFDVMLMERRGGLRIKTPEWQKYLHMSFVQNKPYDQLNSRAKSSLPTDRTPSCVRPRSFISNAGKPIC